MSPSPDFWKQIAMMLNLLLFPKLTAGSARRERPPASR
jgi:hypothetical protein